jgi:hypothetical protein
MTSFLPIADGPNVNSKLYDNIYVSSSNSLTSAGRVVTGQAAKISLPSKSFSAEVQVVNLPSNMLLGHTQLILKVPATAVPPGSYLLDNWGYQAIQYYEFVFSDSERLRIDSPQLMIKNLADVESGEKKNLVSSLSEIKTGASFSATPGVYNKQYYQTSISIYLPFSNLSSSRVHPFPGDVMERPVQLTIAFNNWLQVLQYPQGNAAVIQAALSTVTGYSDSYVMCKTMYLLDPSDSIKELVSLRGNSKYCYPYIYPQSFVSSTQLDGLSAVGTNQGTDSAPTGIMSVPLTRFLNANLQSIDLFLLRTTAGNLLNQPTAGAPANGPLSASVWNQNYFSKMVNCRLSYAGQTIWRSDDSSDTLINLSEYPTSTTFNSTVYPYGIVQTNVPPADEVVSGVSTTSNWLHIQLSQLNERFFSNLSQVGPTLHTNEVLFEFNVLPRRDQETFGLNTAAGSPNEGPQGIDYNIQPKYRLYAVYNYSAAVRVARGAVNLVFQPELTVYPSISGIEGTY